MRRHAFCALGAALAVLFAAPPAPAQDGDVLDRTPERCITVSRMRQTRVVDDRTILFYTRGRRVYRNELPVACPRLALEERIGYESRVGRLCNSDTIWVIESFGGGLQRGATCRLGMFHPITRQEAADILAGPEGARRDAVEVEAVELPDEDAEATDDDRGAQAEPAGEDGAAPE